MIPRHKTTVFHETEIWDIAQGDITQAFEEGKQFHNYVEMGNYLFKKHLDITNPVNMLDRALDEYAKALELQPSCPDVILKTARIFLKKGNYKKAETLARKALSQDPSLWECHYILGYLAYKNQATQKALASLEDALRLGGHFSAKVRLCLYFTLLDRLKTESLKPGETCKIRANAWAQLAMAMALLPFEPERIPVGQMCQVVPAVLGIYCREQYMGDHDGSLKKLLKFQEAYPGFPMAMNMLARMYQNRQQQDAANFWLHRTIDRDPMNEEALHQLGELQELHGYYPQAIETYKQLLGLRPRDAQLHCKLGNLYYLESDFDQTMAHYKSALLLKEETGWKATLAQSLGTLYLEYLQNPEAAQSAFQMAIELNPDDIESYIHLGILYFEKADYENAQLLYEKAIAIAPENPRLHSNLAYLRWIADDIEDAVRLYEQAIALDPGYDIPYNNLGVIHLDVFGNMPRAIELMETAIRLNENYALAYYNLGRAYSFMNQKLKAAQYYQKAQTLNAYTQELDNEELTDRINNLFQS